MRSKSKRKGRSTREVEFDDSSGQFEDMVNPLADPGAAAVAHKHHHTSKTTKAHAKNDAEYQAFLKMTNGGATPPGSESSYSEDEDDDKETDRGVEVLTKKGQSRKLKRKKAKQLKKLEQSHRPLPQEKASPSATFETEGSEDFDNPMLMSTGAMSADRNKNHSTFVFNKRERKEHTFDDKDVKAVVCVCAHFSPIRLDHDVHTTLTASHTYLLVMLAEWPPY